MRHGTGVSLGVNLDLVQTYKQYIQQGKDGNTVPDQNLTTTKKWTTTLVFRFLTAENACPVWERSVLPKTEHYTEYDV